MDFKGKTFERRIIILKCIYYNLHYSCHEIHVTRITPSSVSNETKKNEVASGR